MATKSTPPKKTLAQRLLIKTGMRVALLNAPQDYTRGELPAEAQVQNSVGPAGTCDVVQLFAATVAELNAHFAAKTRSSKAVCCGFATRRKKARSRQTSAAMRVGKWSMPLIGWV
jgi:hypothetical protein